VDITVAETEDHHQAEEEDTAEVMTETDVTIDATTDVTIDATTDVMIDVTTDATIDDPRHLHHEDMKEAVVEMMKPNSLLVVWLGPQMMKDFTEHLIDTSLPAQELSWTGMIQDDHVDSVSLCLIK